MMFVNQQSRSESRRQVVLQGLLVLQPCLFCLCTAGVGGIFGTSVIASPAHQALLRTLLFMESPEIT
jgi:hypothetical protein